MKRMLLIVGLAMLGLSSVGCCCSQRPFWKLCNCNGCGDSYYGDWAEGRANCNDCCDCYGGWTGGRRAGFMGSGGYQSGYVNGSEQWSEEQVVEPSAAPAAAAPTPAEPAPQPAPTGPSARRAPRARPVNRESQYAPVNYYGKSYRSNSSGDPRWTGATQPWQNSRSGY